MPKEGKYLWLSNTIISGDQARFSVRVKSGAYAARRTISLLRSMPVMKAASDTAPYKQQRKSAALFLGKRDC